MWLLTALIPSFGPKTLLLALLALAGAVLLASVFGLTYYAGVQHERVKLVVLDMQWRLKIEQANREAENEANARVQAAHDASAAVVPVPADDAGIGRMCDEDTACRDGAKHKRGR